MLAHYRIAIRDSLIVLCKVNPSYHQPNLYAVPDEMGKIYYHDLDNKSFARRYFTEAYYYCNLCVECDGSHTAERDLQMLRTYLTDSSYCG